MFECIPVMSQIVLVLVKFLYLVKLSVLVSLVFNKDFRINKVYVLVLVSFSFIKIMF